MRKLFLFSHVCLQAGERKSHAQIRKKPSLFVLFVNLYIKEKNFHYETVYIWFVATENYIIIFGMFRLTLAPHKVQLLNYKTEINKQIRQ